MILKKNKMRVIVKNIKKNFEINAWIMIKFEKLIKKYQLFTKAL